MSTLPRLNGIIRALEQGKPVFVTFAPIETTPVMALRSSPYDGLVFELEHSPYDIRGLTDSLQYLLDRRQIHTSGSLAPAVTPLARIAVNGCEMNQWQAKQVLDMGVYGVVWPHVSTVAEARNAVSACRYPRPPGSARYEPAGMRGDSPMRAAWYWGLTADEYYARADVWPLDPKGEILVAIMCEEVAGVKNLPQILEQVPGIGAVIIGRGDLSQDMGLPRQSEHPAVMEKVAEALAACQKYNVPCGLAGVEVDNIERFLKQGFRWFMAAPKPSYAVAEKGRLLAGR